VVLLDVIDKVGTDDRSGAGDGGRSDDGGIAIASGAVVCCILEQNNKVYCCIIFFPSLLVPLVASLLNKIIRFIVALFFSCHASSLCDVAGDV
jgi:hypothetical protein